MPSLTPDQALAEVSRIAEMFSMPMPQVEFVPPGGPPCFYDPRVLGCYIDSTIFFRTDLILPRTIWHEMGHHHHTLLGLPCNRDECERYARMFEELYKSGGLALYCDVCGLAQFNILHDASVECRNCRSVYNIP